MEVVIAEKYNAAQKIASILCDHNPNRTSLYDTPVFEWDDTRVVGLAGHIVETDFGEGYAEWSDCHPSELISAPIEKRPSKPDLVKAVESLGKKADTVIIATDYDREGELIGTEAYELIESVNSSVSVERALFSSLTPKEVGSAFNNTESLDRELAAAGEARQRIDLRWGASLTRFLTLLAERDNGILSVGRVQTPTLKIVVDREREIENFDPDSYWEIYTDFSTQDNQQSFEAMYFYYDEDDNQAERIWNEKRSKAVASDIDDALNGEVIEVETSTRNDNPPIPFNTTEFIKAANAIGYDAKPAMSIAESLYDDGYITYPRTDNTVYPDDMDEDAIFDSLRNVRELQDDVDLIRGQESLDPTAGDEETTDHPPIHPTTTLPSRNELDDDEWDVYLLVARRFLATFADAAVWERTRIDIDVDGHRHKMSGKLLREEGYHAVYPYFDTDEESVADVEEGDTLRVGEVSREEKETQPPNRYGQSRLVEEMESEGLGTKSTRHNTIDKLYDRGYLRSNPPRPTDLARVVIDTVEDHAELIASTEMTSQLESDMEAIADGEKQYTDVTGESRDILEKVFEQMSGDETQIRQQLQEYVETRDDEEERTMEDAIGRCGECDGLLLPQETQDGAQFIGCSEYPDCEVTYPLPNKGGVHLLDETCDEHGFNRVKMLAGKYTKVYGCPACQQEKAENTVDREIGPCLGCSDGSLAIKRLETGNRLAGCTTYPECEYAVPLPGDGDITICDAVCDEHSVKEIEIDNDEYDGVWELGCPVCNYNSYNN